MTAQPKAFFGSAARTMRAALLVALPEDTAVVFEIHGDDGGVWTVARKGDDVTITAGDHRGPDCRLACTAADFELLATGALPPAEALNTGRIGVEGDVGIALSLRDAVAEQFRKAS